MQIIWTKWQMWLQMETSCRLSPIEFLLRDAKMISYIKQCIRLAWRMVTQVPAMTIEYQSSYLQNFHNRKGYHSSPYMKASGKASAGEEIACYLWPGLFDGGGRLIHAGEVLCKTKN